MWLGFDILLVHGALLLFGITFGVILFFVKMKIMKPVSPFLDAQKKGKDVVVVINNKNRIKVIPVDKAGIENISQIDEIVHQSRIHDIVNGIISIVAKKYAKPKYPLPWEWIRENAKLYQISGVRVMFILDSMGALDPDNAEKFYKLKEQGIIDYPSLSSAIDNGIVDKNDPFIASFYKQIHISDILQYISDMDKSDELRPHLDEEASIIIAKFNKKMSGVTGLDMTGVILLLIGIVVGYAAVNGGITV